MATGLVIHISSGENKHTEILTSERIRIGSCDDCELRVELSNLPQTGENRTVLELSLTNGSYRVTGLDVSLLLTHNDEPLQLDAEIHDGDEVRVQASALALQFFPIRSLPAVVSPQPHDTHVAPFIEQAAIESAATARRDDAKVFLREFTRELVREISTSTKLITLAIAIALVGGVLYLGFAMYKEVQRSQHLIRDQGTQLAEVQTQGSNTSKQIAEVVRATRELQESLSLAVKVRSDYGNGVCLIAGSYYYVEAGTGRPLRYPEAQLSESGGAVQNADEPSALTPEGRAAIAEYEFVGTGFYVGSGFVLTNRHIAQPWLADDHAQSMSASVRAQPRLKKLTAYFPNYSQPILLKFRSVAKKDDLSVCSLDLADVPSGISPLPLETDPDAVAVGKTVVMMGYPNGLDRLLALLDDAESRGIQQRYGSLDAQLSYLAETRHIQPLTTQGIITSLDVRRISYDARTAEGGSGAPLFGPSGRVIGVNFAVFTENDASNFAVPISYAISLLELAGWERPVLKDGKEPEVASSQTAGHSTSSPAK